MKLSVLIVNYNVCYFTEHCVWSVLKAAEVMQHHKPAWQTEILVFDNASADNSAVYLPMLFGDKISFFSSGTNLGFGKANNQLLEKATGEYILYLNPDTMIPEDCLLNHVRFAESADNFGASGIRMIDGRGKFLPESKRGFPGTWVSFTKMAGLAKAFPESKLFAQYYVGHLDENTTAEVPVLSGAYL
ncbi:MAG: glycosyltransferase, partial [Flavitalea sp.]